MDNDVPGTDYCIGFSTCVTRTIEMTHALRTSAGIHERFLVIEVFGRYAGFTALLPTMAGAANRCVIPEHPFDIEHSASCCPAIGIRLAPTTASFWCRKAQRSPASPKWFTRTRKGHVWPQKLGGVGDRVARPSGSCPRNSTTVAGSMSSTSASATSCVRGSRRPRLHGADGLRQPRHGSDPGRGVRQTRQFRNGRYDNVPIDVVTSRKKVVDVDKFDNTERLRPKYTRFEGEPVFIMTSDY